MPYVTCPECDRESLAPRDLIGLKWACPGCSTLLTVSNDGRPTRTARRRRNDSGPWVALVGLGFAGLVVFGLLALAVSRAGREPERQPPVAAGGEHTATPNIVHAAPSGQPLLPNQPKETNTGQMPLKTVTCKFGEWISSGDLHVRVINGYSGDFPRGVVGNNERLDLLVLHVEAKNSHAGKIIDWPGWRNKGGVEDEFGNKFKPTEGWSIWYDPFGIGEANDFPQRIPPTQGNSIKAVLYFERVPYTSKAITITLPFNGSQVKVTLQPPELAFFGSGGSVPVLA